MAMRSPTDTVSLGRWRTVACIGRVMLPLPAVDPGRARWARSRTGAAPRAAFIIARPMIAFGCSIIMPEAYERFAKPGIERAAEPDSPILANAAVGSIARSYNLLLDE